MTQASQSWLSTLLADQPLLLDHLADFPEGLIQCVLLPFGRSIWLQGGNAPRLFTRLPPPASDIPATRLIIRGSPGAWLALLGNGDWSGLHSEGDEALREHLAAFLQQPGIDWQALLRPYLGEDLLAALSQSFEQGSQWWQRQRHSLREDVREYLTHELSLFPDRAQANTHREQLQQLAQQLQALQARIGQLENPE